MEQDNGPPVEEMDVADAFPDDSNLAVPLLDLFPGVKLLTRTQREGTILPAPPLKGFAKERAWPPSAFNQLMNIKLKGGNDFGTSGMCWTKMWK